MTTIIGVRFRKTGKIYYFDPTGFEIEKGDHVIVETIRGVEYGTVVLAPKQMDDDQVIQPLKPLIRKATEEDAQINEDNQAREKDAYQICLEKIHKHGLSMKLIDSEYTFDRNKLLFYFTADGRIDFRELVKDLASVFRTRIELRQIGVRDETKLLGGIAICGRPLCCHSYLSDFAPVSIKMAKEQNLSLNPAKISGVCGRLMCCLKNEEEAYEYLNKKLPHVNSTVTTADGYQGVVQSVNVLKQMVKVKINKDNDEKEVYEYPVSELRFRRRQKNDSESVAIPLPDEELDENALMELQKMEQNDLEDLAEESEDEMQKPFNKRPFKENNYYRKNDRNNDYRNNDRNGSHNKQSSSGNRNKKPYNGTKNSSNRKNHGEVQGDNHEAHDKSRNNSNRREHSRKENRRHYNNNIHRR